MIPTSSQFRRLWAGQATSQLGNRVQQLAVSWWVLQTTGSPTRMGLVLLAGSLPVVLGSPIAGVLADRFDRRTLMLVADGISAVLVTGMALLAWKGMLGFPLLLVIMALLGAMTALLTPASLSMVPALVEGSELVAANALQEATTQGSGIVGPALGGYLVSALGAPFAFAANALSFLSSATLLASMKPQPRPVGTGSGSIGAGLVEGLEVLRELPAVTWLLLSFAAINVVFAALPVLLPLFASRVFACGAGGLGMMEGSLGLGLVVSALGMARVRTLTRRVSLIAACMGLQGLLLLASGGHPAFLGFALALFGMGAALSVINAIALSTFQQVIPPAKLGRFMGLLMAVVMGTMPLSYAGFGMLAAHAPLEVIWRACGVGLIAVGLALAFIPAVRSLDRGGVPAAT